ncbi:MAG: DUF1080 domain-containing protein [Verrucomicrobia bacterium]|nr:DUF1080 domain-containing protein [Verrucomicrobiota bacterium]
MKTQLIALTVILSLAGGSVCSAGDAKMKPIFDGKTLDGWAPKGGTAEYRAEDGCIVGKTVEGSPNTFLCTTRDYADFVLEFDVKCDVELNSGCQIRSHVYEKDWADPANPKRVRKAGSVYGYQCEIATEASGSCGNFWDEARQAKWWDDFSKKPEAKKAFKDNQWNHYRIVAQGDHMRSWVNGVPAADFCNKIDASGFIGLQVHGIKKGTGPFQVRWKNIRLRELKPDEKVK